MDSLLEQAVAGSSDARDELVRRFSRQLSAYVSRAMGARIRRQHSAADICQETFVRVFRSIETLPGDASLEDFKRRLFCNAKWVITGKAEVATRFVGESAVGDCAIVAGDRTEATSQSGQVTKADDWRLVAELVKALRPEYGDVIRLRMEGVEFNEIAHRLGVKVDTVRKRYSRACDVLESQIAAKQRSAER